MPDRGSGEYQALGWRRWETKHKVTCLCSVMVPTLFTIVLAYYLIRNIVDSKTAFDFSPLIFVFGVIGYSILWNIAYGTYLSKIYGSHGPDQLSVAATTGNDGSHQQVAPTECNPKEQTADSSRERDSSVASERATREVSLELDPPPSYHEAIVGSKLQPGYGPQYV